MREALFRDLFPYPWCYCAVNSCPQILRDVRIFLCEYHAGMPVWMPERRAL